MAKSQKKTEPAKDVETIETTPESFLESKGISPAIKESPLTLSNFQALVDLLNEYKEL